jgi:hypothetical protein
MFARISIALRVSSSIRPVGCIHPTLATYDERVKRVVLCGDDHLLLTVRAAVLRPVPFVIEPHLGLAELMTYESAHSPSLFVLCNSMSFQTVFVLKLGFREAFPSVPVITLVRSDDPADSAFEHPLAFAAGPAGLVELTKTLTQ